MATYSRNTSSQPANNNANSKPLNMRSSQRTITDGDLTSHAARLHSTDH